jgi:CRISPR/Cas system CMR subunit Cmr4 (Cas7 group RAMP superfamily)
VFDVGNLSAGVFTLQHTETRKAAAELTQAIDKLLADKKSSPKDLERLHGRLIWFSAFIFGRMINQMVKQVSAMSLQRTRVVRSDEIFFQHCIT